MKNLLLVAAIAVVIGAAAIRSKKIEPSEPIELTGEWTDLDDHWANLEYVEYLVNSDDS